MDKFLNLNPLVLAFVGDAVYAEKVRAYLVSIEPPAKVNNLHKKANSFVCCEYQAKVFRAIEPMLTETEQNISGRARNVKKNTVPKHGERGDYNKSTELEAIIGYNHLTENFERVNEIMEIALKGNF